MIQYRVANSGDNQQLLKLTSSTGMSGKMALRIDRQPNFFALNTLRGKTKVYVAIENDAIVGSICVSDQEVYIDKKKYPLYYISDLKVAKTHRKLGIGYQLTNEVARYLESQNADFAFLNVSKGNKKPIVFFSGRAHYPDFENIGVFKTFQYIGSEKKSSKSKYTIELTEETPEVLNFLNSYYSKYDLANVITSKTLETTNLYTVKQGQELIAVMGIIDTMPMKQNVVLKMPWHLKYILAGFNAFSKLLGNSKLPREHEPIKMLYINYFALKEDDKSLISELINYARSYAYEKTYSFVSLSLHERDSLIKKLPNIIKFTFYSIGMLISLKDSKALMTKIKQGVPFKDYSSV